MNPDWLPTSPWVSCTAPLTSGTAIRTPQLLEQVVAQFAVETSTRYRPGRGKTYCNIFSWDVTRALGCEVPHWAVSKELTANDTAKWLSSAVGIRHGWESAAEPVARGYAAAGKPALAVWVNSSGPGHIAVVLPSRGEATYIAQAGAKNFSRGPLADGFGARKVSFYVHA